MDKDAEGKWDFSRIFETRVMREWCWFPISVFVWPPSSLRRIMIRTRVDDYISFFAPTQATAQDFTTKVVEPLKALLQRFSNLAEMEIDWIWGWTNLSPEAPLLRMGKALEEMLKTLPQMREIHVHRDSLSVPPPQYVAKVREEGKNVRLVRSGGRWFTVGNLYKMKEMQRLMRERARQRVRVEGELSGWPLSIPFDGGDEEGGD